MRQTTDSLHHARPQDERVDELILALRRRYTGDPTAIRVVRAPLRISPLGAHIDHQLGRVTGMAVDRSILFAFAPTTDGSLHVESLDFATTTDFTLTNVPPYVKGDWGNYLRGAVVALQRDQQLTHGLPPCGAPDGEAGASASSTVDHPAGRKSQAVFELGSGMPGVSGEAKASGPPMSARRAKEPGVVPCACVEGLCAPCMGSA